LVTIRDRQGYSLQILTPEELQTHYPHVSPQAQAALYSPQDLQVNPLALTQALVQAAQQRGVAFYPHTTVESLIAQETATTSHCQAIHWREHSTSGSRSGTIQADWVILTAGLNTKSFMSSEFLLRRRYANGVQSFSFGDATRTEFGVWSSEVETQKLEFLTSVLGQALRVRSTQPLGNPQMQPVITGHDIHIAPLGHQEFWIGATVEFPHTVCVTSSQEKFRSRSISELRTPNSVRVASPKEKLRTPNPEPRSRSVSELRTPNSELRTPNPEPRSRSVSELRTPNSELRTPNSIDPVPDPTALEAVWQGAIELCPGLAGAEILQTWSGLRPRPVDRSAPIIEKWADYDNVIVATGHYRNGVLLAPATAQVVREMMELDQ
jgi:glycine/D-amino acid oxidase-like deaminating enzyme